MNILENLRKNGLLLKKSNEENYQINMKILNILGKLPLLYNGDINIINIQLQDIKKNYPKYSNFIDNYFIKYKLPFFISGEYNYGELPEDCRSNSYLEK